MRTFYSIGLLYKIFGDDSQCEGYLKQVYRRCLRYLPEDDRKTARIKSMLLGMNVDLAEAAKEPPNQRGEESYDDRDNDQDLEQGNMGEDEEADVDGF